MSDPAVITALPAHLRTLRESVEQHAPAEGIAGFWRAATATWLFAVELLAERLVEAMPATAAAPRPQQVQHSFHAPLGDRSPVIEEPLVRRRGHDERLRGKRPHP